MGSIRIKKIYARRGEEDRVFSSVAEAAEFVKGIKHMIYKCCEGKRGYHHGWMFSYKPFEPIDKTEEWRDVVGFEGKYQVSNKGNVRTFQRDRSMLLKLKDWFGYRVVTLWDNKVRKDTKVHRLVAEAFIPNPDNLPIINHKDENPSNNCVENLEWCTQQYNVTYGSAIRKRIKSNKRVKPVVMLGADGKFEMEFDSSADAARYVGGSNSNVLAVCKKRNKTCKGKVFMYKDEWLIKEGYFNKEYLCEKK